LGVFVREPNAPVVKPKQIQTATMKRRSLKVKSIEAAPTKARNPHLGVVVVSTQLPGIELGFDQSRTKS
jgi:hypothetical protein